MEKRWSASFAFEMLAALVELLLFTEVELIWWPAGPFGWLPVEFGPLILLFRLVFGKGWWVAGWVEASDALLTDDEFDMDGLGDWVDEWWFELVELFGLMGADEVLVVQSATMRLRSNLSNLSSLSGELVKIGDVVVTIEAAVLLLFKLLFWLSCWLFRLFTLTEDEAFDDELLLVFVLRELIL